MGELLLQRSVIWQPVRASLLRPVTVYDVCRCDEFPRAAAEAVGFQGLLQSPGQTLAGESPLLACADALCKALLLLQHGLSLPAGPSSVFGQQHSAGQHCCCFLLGFVMLCTWLYLDGRVQDTAQHVNMSTCDNMLKHLQGQWIPWLHTWQMCFVAWLVYRTLTRVQGI